jgi:ring-1,2-phenylacetyl-CoA epoxidase subunit PaaD
MVTGRAGLGRARGDPGPRDPRHLLVDLGVIRDVGVENGTVRVGFTPTFLGCPALEVMRDAMAERIRELGAQPRSRC